MTGLIDERFENSQQIHLLQESNRELSIQFWEQEFKEYFGPRAFLPLNSIVMLFGIDNPEDAIFESFERELYSNAWLNDGWRGILNCAKRFYLRVPDLVMECLCNSCACRECKTNCSGRTCEQCKAEYGSGYNSYCDD